MRIDAVRIQCVIILVTGGVSFSTLHFPFFCYTCGVIESLSIALRAYLCRVLVVGLAFCLLAPLGCFVYRRLGRFLIGSFRIAPVLPFLWVRLDCPGNHSRILRTASFSRACYL